MIQMTHQELRFTRARQALPFWLSGAVSFAAALTLVVTAAHRDENPLLPHPAWALLPLIGAAGCLWLAWQMTRHAYLILSPVGVEIFPLLFPSRHFAVVSWQEIDSAELSGDSRWLTLHFNRERTSGTHLTLKPIPTRQRALLAQAVLQRVQEINRQRGDTANTEIVATTPTR